jgi:hypothetical protein
MCLGVIGAGYFCKERGFKREIQDFILKIVPCTRRLWQLTKVQTTRVHIFNAENQAFQPTISSKYLSFAIYLFVEARLILFILTD